MPYTLSIIRNGDIIFEKEIDADSVINMLTGGVPTDSTEEEPDEEVERPKRKYKKKKAKKEKPAKEAKEERRGKGLRHCKKCGETGHRSDNCPKDATGGENDEDTRASDNFGSDAPGNDAEEEAVAEGAMSRETFYRIKGLKNRNMSAEQIANETEIPIEEIKIATGAVTYNGYLDLRN